VSDGKEPGALRTIGEVATALGVRQHVLRYWEQQFPMLRPLKRSGGRRYYRREDVELLSRISTLINLEGYTLKGARQAIEKGPAAADQPSPDLSTAEASTGPEDSSSDTVLASLKRIRARLAASLEAAS
jgi:DNA-binding transcriptional MerR regulator